MFDFRKTVSHLGGWLTESEGQLLFRLSSQVPNRQRIVEIGSWKGKSTICLAKGVEVGNKTKILAVDPHIGSSEHQRQFGKVDTFDTFLTNIRTAGVKKYVEAIRKTSAAASENVSFPLGLVFIDGAHEYFHADQDITLWFPKIANGGIIAIHDSWHHIGPNLASIKLLLTSNYVRAPYLVDTITYMQKVARNSWIDRLYNICFVGYRTLFGIVGFIRISIQSKIV